MCTSYVNVPVIHIDEIDINNYIYKLKPSWSSGPDNLPSSVLKKIARYICFPLSVIFNYSLEKGEFPGNWKTSFIIPLYKSGPRNDVSNYRGISKLSCVPKMFEAIVTDHISFYCKSLITPRQHGFIKGRSTNTNLIEITSTIVNNFENRSQTDVIYTDFSKAFDRVNHKMLIKKLDLLGLPTWLLKWISSYLCNRTQRVIFKNKRSDEIKVTSGVPQGSHIGPLLFILFINDVCDYIQHSSILLYADDCKIYKSIENTNDSSLLQEDLNSFNEWCRCNKMSLNVKKCFVMSFSRDLNTQFYDYTFDDVLVNRTSAFTDLGVLFDPKCTFCNHIDLITSKAYGKLGCITRWSKELKDDDIYKTLFCSLVRSQLEYCCSVWCPRYNVHISIIESVQKQFLLRLLRTPRDNYVLPNYKLRLMSINFLTLEDRRFVLNINFICNVLNGSINCDIMLNNLYINVRTRPTRLQSFNNFIKIRHTIRNYSTHEPITALFIDYNKICNLVDFNLSANSVKNVVKNNLLSNYVSM